MTDSTSSDAKKKAKRSNRMFRCVVVGGVLFLASVAVITSGIAVYFSVLDNRIAKLEQRIRDKGQPVTLAELEATYPEVPDEENAALVYSEAFARFEEIDPKFD